MAESRGTDPRFAPGQRSEEIGPNPRKLAEGGFTPGDMKSQSAGAKEEVNAEGWRARNSYPRSASAVADPAHPLAVNENCSGAISCWPVQS